MPTSIPSVTTHHTFSQEVLRALALGSFPQSDAEKAKSQAVLRSAFPNGHKASGKDTKNLFKSKELGLIELKMSETGAASYSLTDLGERAIGTSKGPIDRIGGGGLGQQMKQARANEVASKKVKRTFNAESDN